MRDDAVSPSRKFRLLPEDRYLGKTPYIWLGYFPFFFVAPYMAHAGVGVWALHIGAGVLFLALYFRGYWSSGTEAICVIIAISALGFLFIERNGGASVFFSYAGAFAGVLRPRRRAMVTIGMLAIAVAIGGVALDIPAPYWLFQDFLIVMIASANMHFVRVREIGAELRNAREQIEHLARVAERERIARDLHDVLGHTLTLITLKAALAARLAERDPARAADEMRDVERASRDALQEIRAALAGKRDVGLALEVASAETMLEAAGISVERAVRPVSLSPSEEATLALAIREAVTNVVRHAGATICRISLSDDDGKRLLSIEDDGRGKRGPDGNGLAGMRERVKALGGQLVVDAGVVSGTRVRITLAELTP
jgi:two-component system, NarL family, sensor histidine kinase DesK